MSDPEQALQGTDTGGDGAIANASFRSAPISQLEGQVSDIQEVMNGLMQEGTHYDDITGDGRNSLLQPGAEKLCFAFKFAPSFDVERLDYAPEEVPNADEPVEGHREYFVNCELTHRPSGQYVGSGRGSCSTLESKYRYRKVEQETEVPVSGDFWDSYDKDQGENMGDADFTLLEDELVNNGISIPEDGEAGVTKNDDGDWRITIKVEGENPDIADLYNTVLKMAEKRALVNAVKRSTAASDIFTQDTEDLQHLDGSGVKRKSNPSVEGERKRQPSSSGKGQRGPTSRRANHTSQNGSTTGQPEDTSTDSRVTFEMPDGSETEIASSAANQLRKINNKLVDLEGNDLAAAVSQCRSAYDWPDPEASVLEQLLRWHEQRLVADDPDEGRTDPRTHTSDEGGRYDNAQDALESIFDEAWAEGKEDWEPISEAQLNRLYAIADDNDWDEAALNRLVKDELGYDSKKEVPYGDPYDEVCAALEDERLRYHMSRDPDTQDMFEENADEGQANHPEFKDDSDLPF
jgi:hypothetical protein